MTIVILGRQPKLGLAELESLYGAKAVKPLGEHAAVVDAAIDPALLGGALKLAKPIKTLPTTDWRRLSDQCARELPRLLAGLPEGKLRLGLSVYGIHATAQQLFRAGLELKKVCRAAKQSVRIVPATDTALNSAQVLHNQMTGPLGMELLFIKDGAQTVLAQTSWVQDVDDYARRDYGRPKRDARVGMLPPKLAQTMLNLAQVQSGQSVLDPFCGTGVVLLEAALRGCRVYGTDLEPRMVDYTQQNLEWLAQTYGVSAEAQLSVADATNAVWQETPDHVVCETYLGQPLTTLPSPDRLAEITTDCNTIISKFLKNLHGQLPSGARLCIAVPAWRTRNAFKHLPLLDHLESLGYNRLRFTHAANIGDMLYHRADQTVARELLVLTVK